MEVVVNLLFRFFVDKIETLFLLLGCCFVGKIGFCLLQLDTVAKTMFGVRFFGFLFGHLTIVDFEEVATRSEPNCSKKNGKKIERPVDYFFAKKSGNLVLDRTHHQIQFIHFCFI